MGVSRDIRIRQGMQHLKPCRADKRQRIPGRSHGRRSALRRGNGLDCPQRQDKRTAEMPRRGALLRPMGRRTRKRLPCERRRRRLQGRHLRAPVHDQLACRRLMLLPIQKRTRSAHRAFIGRTQRRRIRQRLFINHRLAVNLHHKDWQRPARLRPVAPPRKDIRQLPARRYQP